MFSEKFIAATEEYATMDNHIPAPYFRKNFYIKEKCQANVTICGLGYYRLFINGKEITKSYMAAYTANPNHILYYDYYDLSDLLQKGKNVLGIVLGNGFLNNIGGYVWKFDQADYRTAPKVAFALQIGNDMIEADESVKVHASPITFNDMHAGEHYDATLEIDGWANAEFDDSNWDNAIVAETPKGEKRIADIVPIRIKEERRAVKIIEGAEGYIYDFGINTSGIVRLKINGQSGQKVKIIHSELINDGKADTSNIDFIGVTKPDYNQCVRYTCKEGVQTYQPSFTYMGFRYAYVTGITKEQAKDDLLTMLLMHSDVRQTGDFHCSDENINALYRNTLNSTLSNFYHFLSDCPQREKNGWTGDVALGVEQVMLNFDAAKNLREWLVNVRKTQLGSGMLPCIIPTAGWGYTWGNGPAWDAALTETTYRILQFTDDLTIVEENADAIYKYIKYMKGKINENGLADYGLGDWCQVGAKNGEMFDTPLRVTDTLVCKDMCEKASKMFMRIGQETRAKFCEDLASALRQAFRSHCLGRDLFVEGKTQTGLAMAIYYGIFNEDEKMKAFNNLLELIKEKDDHFNVGVLGARVLFRVLADFGYTSLAHKLLLNETFPSFLYHLKLGATSLWESFYELNERFEVISGFPGEILSQNHYFWGDIAAFFIEYIAGITINPQNDDYRNVTIFPNYMKGVNEVRGHKEMPYGNIETHWIYSGNLCKGTVMVPEGAIAVFVFPDGQRQNLQQGENNIIFTIPEVSI